MFVGDILGRALQNLDGLLRMPYGCGEQNMALLAPNIYILEYLTNTEQLTPAIKEKATNFLTSGESVSFLVKLKKCFMSHHLNHRCVPGVYGTEQIFSGIIAR